MKLTAIACAAGLLLVLASTGSAADTRGAIKLFNGKDLAGWRASGEPGLGHWKVGKAALDPKDPSRLAVTGGGSELVSCDKGPNLYSEAKFADCLIDFEFMVASNSNSGIKLMNIYEIQILDSYGKASPTSSDCGAIYKESAPRVNASRPAGEWQRMEIEFRAPRFDSTGTKVANAKFVKVTLNGKTIQENFEIEHGTNVSRNAKELPEATLFLQGDHGPVAFRNFYVTALR